MQMATKESIQGEFTLPFGIFMLKVYLHLVEHASEAHFSKVPNYRMIFPQVKFQSKTYSTEI